MISEHFRERQGVRLWECHPRREKAVTSLCLLAKGIDAEEICTSFLRVTVVYVRLEKEVSVNTFE